MGHAQPISVDDRYTDPVVATGGQTVFTYDFWIRDAAHLVVQQNDGTNINTLVLGVDYTVSGVDDPSGGTVTLLTGATAGHVYTIFGDLPLERTSVVESGQTVVTTQLNDDVIRLFMATQELKRRMGLAEANIGTAAPLELQSDGTNLEWRPAGGVFQDLVPLAQIGANFREVATIAALRLVTAGVTDEMVYVAEQTTGLGVGGGLFRRDPADVSTADDGVFTIVDAASRRWKRIYDGRAASLHWFGVSGDGVTDDTAALNSAIAWLNGASKRTLFVPDGTYIVSTGPLDEITGTDKTIAHIGARHAARFVVPTGVSNGNVFNVGDGGTTTTARILISGCDVQVIDGGATTGWAYEVDGANDVSIVDSRLINVAGIARIGNSAQCARPTLLNFSGTFNGASNQDQLYVRHATGGRYRDVHLTGSTASTGAMVKYLANGLNDSHWFDNVHLFTSAFSSYGIFIDINAQDVVNAWFTDCVFDKTSTAGMFIRASTGAFECRNIVLKGTRFDTAGGGPAVLIQESSASACIIRNINIIGCVLTYRDDNAVIVNNNGSGYVGGINLVGNDFQEASSVTINAAVEIGCSEFLIASNQFGYAEDTFNSHTTHAVKVTADVTNFVIAGNVFHCPQNGIDHFAYAADDNDRQWYGNTGTDDPFIARLTAERLITASGGELTISTGAITVTHSRHTVDTEGDAASDVLDTINGGEDGMLLRLSIEDDARNVVVTHGTSIKLETATITLDQTFDSIVLENRGGTWCQWSAAINDGA